MLKIENLQAVRLDEYLHVFFSTVQKKLGGEYSPKSLKALREGFERHLKACGYPFSITHDRLFLKSQLAYKRRIEDLQLKKNIKDTTI